MARQRLIQAINSAVREEMERDEKVFIYGEDVEVSIFGDVRGLVEVFGKERVRNTPISENTISAMAVGAAACGYRPIVQMMFANFLFTGMDGIANQMAKARLMSGGQIELPITIICSYGGGRANAAQHSDTPYGAFMGLGGIHVVTPSNSADAKGLMKSAIRCNDPVIYFVPGGLGGSMGDVPDEEYLTPIGKAAVSREGTDVTLISMGTGMRWTLQAAKQLSEQGVEAHVLDLRSLAPMDEEAICAAVQVTGRVVIVDEARERGSAASQISAVIAEKSFGQLKAPIKRVTTPNISFPYAPASEQYLLPNSDKVVKAVMETLNA